MTAIITHRHIRAMKRLKELHDKGFARATTPFIGDNDAAIHRRVLEPAGYVFVNRKTFNRGFTYELTHDGHKLLEHYP